MPNSKALQREGRRVLERYLAESGISHRWRRSRERGADSSIDAEVDIKLPSGQGRRLIVEFNSNPRRVPLEAAVAQLRNYIAHSRASDALPFIFSWHLGAPMRAWLRDQRVWFADLSGNRFFSAPGLLIDREVSKQPERQESAPSVFADRSSLLLRYLLPRPPQQIGVRALARKLKLSPAAVSVGLRRLQRMGHLERDSRKLSLLDRESLLEEWVSFYRPRFKRQGQSRYFVRAKNVELIIARLRSMPLAADDGYGLSLHAGASLISPFVQFREVHLYVQPYGGPLQKRLKQAAGAQEASSEANLVILEPFYRSSVFFDARMLHGVRVVSDLQLYLDLSCFPQRGMEQAQVILENRLRPSWAKR